MDAFIDAVCATPEEGWAVLESAVSNYQEHATRAGSDWLLTIAGGTMAAQLLSCLAHVEHQMHEHGHDDHVERMRRVRERIGRIANGHPVVSVSEDTVEIIRRERRCLRPSL